MNEINNLFTFDKVSRFQEKLSVLERLKVSPKMILQPGVGITKLEEIIIQKEILLF